MGVLLDTQVLIDNISADELKYVIKICKAGIAAALREGDMKAYFTFCTKEQAYSKVLSIITDFYWPRRKALRDWEKNCFYPEAEDSCEYLEPYYTLRFPGPAFA